MVGGVRPPASIFRCRCSGFSSWTGRSEPRQRRGKGRERPPLLDRWRGSAREGASDTVSGTVSDAPAAVGGVAPVLMHPCWKAPRPAHGPDDEPRRGGWFLLTVGGMSSWCGWHWPAVFPVDDPVVVLVHCHTPNLYRAVVAWQCVAPVAGVSIAGQRRTAAPRAGRSRLTTTRPLAWYRQDGKRPPARSPRQGTPTNRP